MQIIHPKRSKFKKSTINYNQDNILDIIDIEETLSKNRFIEKVPISDFIYSKFIPSYNPLIIKSPPKKQRKSLMLNQLSKEKISTVRERKSFCFNMHTHKHFLNNINLLTNDNNKNHKFNTENINFDALNNNKFDIKFDKLKIEYKNGYKVLFINEYYPVKLIGSGAFGLVVNAIQIKTGKKMAVKIINKNNINHDTRFDYLKNEVNILNYLNHPRIMKVYDILDNYKYFFIFMELIEGGNLKDLIIKRYLDNKKYLFRDSECSLIMKGIFEALNYLHKKNIIHRDIKPENILFKNKDDLSSVILCDFGLAYHLNNYETSINGTCGTVIYMAPEVLMKRNYDYLIDSFSAGIVLFILCSGGMHPFYSGNQTRKEYINKLLSQKCLCKFSIQMPLLARNLFLKLCKFETMFRYEPYKALIHPWITRCTKSQIPMTLLEEYNKTEKIINFKNLLSTPLALIILKIYLNKDIEIQQNKSMKVMLRTSSKTINAINSSHKPLNLKDKYLLLSNVKKNSKMLFNENNNNNNNIINDDEIEKEKEKEIKEKDRERRTGRNKLASININHNIKSNKNNVKIQDHSNTTNKNYFIKTGLTYHNKNNNMNINQNYIDIKSSLRTHSSKDNVNSKDNNKISKLKRNQKKSAGHIVINNIKINKDKEKSNVNIHRNKLYLSEKKNNEANNKNINLINNNNKLLLSKHIIIESKNKNKNFTSDVKKNNSLSSNRVNYYNENNANNIVAILERSRYNFNNKINLQLKSKDNNNKVNNNNFLNNQRYRGKNTLLKEVFNNEDF